MSVATSRLLGVGALAVLAAGGCGSSGHARAARTATTAPPAAARAPATPPRATPTPTPTTPTPTPRVNGRITLPDPPATGRPASAADLRVIRGWADTLRRGDVRGAAGYFRLPSEMINGPAANGTVSVVQIHSRVDAEAANAALPCGARLEAADQRGVYINALFALTGRPGLGGGCQGTTGTGRVNFVIRGGRIVRWIRARDEAGDGARGRTGAPNGGTQPPPGATGTSPSAAAV
jgi:hypothetical protein